jgi:opacity protein-like surface antigen
MRQLVLSVVALTALVPAWSAAQAPADPAVTAVPTAPTLAPTAIEPAAPAPPTQPPLAPPSAAARSYLFARAGALVPRASDVEAFDTGMTFEVGAGTRLTSYLAVEVATGYLLMTEDKTGSNTDVGSYRITQDLSAVPFVATARLTGRAFGFEGYALAGAGLYLWSLGGKVTSSLYDPYTFSSAHTGFGLHVGAGLSAPLSRRVSLGLEARYLVAQGTFLGRTSNLDSAIVTAGVGYAF